MVTPNSSDFCVSWKGWLWSPKKSWRQPITQPHDISCRRPNLAQLSPSKQQLPHLKEHRANAFRMPKKCPIQSRLWMNLDGQPRKMDQVRTTIESLWPWFRWPKASHPAWWMVSPHGFWFWPRWRLKHILGKLQTDLGRSMTSATTTVKRFLLFSAAQIKPYITLDETPETGKNHVISLDDFRSLPYLAFSHLKPTRFKHDSICVWFSYLWFMWPRFVTSTLLLLSRCIVCLHAVGMRASVNSTRRVGSKSNWAMFGTFPPSLLDFGK